MTISAFKDGEEENNNVGAKLRLKRKGRRFLERSSLIRRSNGMISGESFTEYDTDRGYIPPGQINTSYKREAWRHFRFLVRAEKRAPRAFLSRIDIQRRPL